MSSVILTIGDEILAGHITDTNTKWLARRLFFFGEKLLRVILLPDDEEEIVRWINEFTGTLDFLFVCGGLGSTPDDVTMAAVAKAVKKPLVVSEKALSHMEKLSKLLVERGYFKEEMEVNDAILKMASVVEGSKVLENRAGFCPGITIRRKNTRIFVLPGVPQELTTIFTSEIEGEYITQGEKRYMEELVLSEVEARIAHLLVKLNEEYPGVSVGSYPTFGVRKLVIRAMGEDREQVKKVLEDIKSYSDSLPDI